MDLTKLFGMIVGMLSKATIFILGFAAIALFIVIFKTEGLSGVWNTLKLDVTGIAMKYMTILVIFFLLAGSINHLAKQNPKEVTSILSGEKGKIAMLVLAASMPGPAGGVQMQQAWKNGVVSKANLALCLVAMMGLGITTLLFRATALGPQLTGLWLIMAFILLGQVWLVGKVSTSLTNRLENKTTVIMAEGTNH